MNKSPLHRRPSADPRQALRRAQGGEPLDDARGLELVERQRRTAQVLPAFQPFLHLAEFPRPLSPKDAARSLLLRLVGLPWSQGASGISDLLRQCDWEYFLPLAARHCVAPVLYARLAGQERFGLAHRPEPVEGLAGAVPDEVQNALAKYHTTTLARNVLLLSETESFCDRLHRHGIPVMLLKGIALLQGVYPHPALRPMTDVDILVRKRDLATARQVLASECGYRDAGIESPSAEIVYGRTTLIKEGASSRLSRMLLEVHWDIVPLDYEWKGRRSPAREFWSGAEEVRIGRSMAWTPNDADHLCYIAMHNCVHCFDRLMGLMDVAYLLSRLATGAAQGQGGPELRIADCGLRIEKAASQSNPKSAIRNPKWIWDGLVRRARQYGCRLDLFLNMALAHGMFGVSAPAEVLRELAPVKWHAHLQAWLFTPEAIFDEKFSSVRRYLTRMLSVDRLGDALRLIAWSVFPSRAWRAHKTELGGVKGARSPRLSHLQLMARHAGNAAARIVGRFRKS